MKRVLREAAIVVSLVALFGACSGQGCSCTEPIKGGFPTDKRHPNVVQLRVTESMFSFLESNVSTLIAPLLPGMGLFDVPPSCGGSSEICCGNPQPMCQIRITPRGLVADPTPPNVIHLVFTTELKSLQKIPITYDTGFIGKAKCFAEIDTTQSSTPNKAIDLVTDATFTVDGTSQLTKLKLTNTMINNLDGSMLTLTSQPGDFLCTVANFGAIKNFLLDQLRSQLADQLTGGVNEALCMKCMDLSDCNMFAAECKDGQCVDGADQCIQEIGIDGRMDVGASLASFSPGLSAKMDILLAAGGYATVDSGMSLGMLGGAMGSKHAACVPNIAAPEIGNIIPSRTFQTNVLPSGATPYHLGIGLHQLNLDLIGWGAFDAGALCLNVGAATVAQLTSKTIGLIIPSLRDLVGDEETPMYLVMRPAMPPSFELGKGTFTTDPAGKRVVDDPLIRLSLPQLSLDFLAFVDDRYVRIMTLTADLEAGISLDIDADGKLVPLLGDLSSAFRNLKVSNSDLLGESPDALRAAFPMLLGLAIGQIGNGLAPIALPAVMGLNIKPKAVTTTDPNADGVNQYLAIFADIAAGATVERAVDTRAEIAERVIPSTAAFAVDQRGTTRAPRFDVRVEGLGRADAKLEYSYRLDSGLWSNFAEGPVVGVEDDRLWMQGHHKLQVRARVVGDVDSLDPTPAELDLLVDTVAPTGTMSSTGGELLVAARDLVTPVDALRYRWRTRASDEFGAWSGVATFKLPLGVDPDDVEVEIADEAVNVTRLALHGRTTSPPSSSGCGCELGRAPRSSSGALALAGLVLAFAFARRRGALMMLAIVALSGSACSGGLQKSDFMNPLDQIGRHHDIQTHGGNFYVSAYDDTVGDLVFAEIKRFDEPIGWQYVDGLDEGAPPDTPGDYRHGSAEPGPDVGRYTSLALDKSGSPRIAYYDVTNRSLKFALGPHPFRVHTVDAGDLAKDIDVGRFASISVDDRGVPAIAYMASGIKEGSSFKSELRVAKAKTSTPNAASDWTISVVEQTRIPCGGRCDSGSACIMPTTVNMMPNGDPSLASCIAIDTQPCPSTCATEEACIGAKCVAFVPENKTPDLPEGTGLFARTLRSKGGLLQILYYDRSQGDLKLALESMTGTYTIALVDGGSPSTDVGQFATAVADDMGLLHVAYVDAISDRLLYKTISGGVPTMGAEVIDDGLRQDGQHSVGGSAAIALASGGTVRVLYQDQTLSDLREARRNGSWSSAQVSSGIAGYGFGNRLTWVNKDLYLSQFVYDRGAGEPIGLFNITKLAP